MGKHPRHPRIPASARLCAAVLWVRGRLRNRATGTAYSGLRFQRGARRWTVAEYSNSHPSAQESNLFRHFAEQAQSGSLNEAWPQMALKTQQVMEACRESSLSSGQLVELEAGG